MLEKLKIIYKNGSLACLVLNKLKSAQNGFLKIVSSNFKRFKIKIANGYESLFRDDLKFSMLVSSN